MRESTCKDCRSWEEDMYWTHFQCLHFSQVLQPGFHQRLAIPERYTSNLKRKLPEIVSLKGPSGTVWKVGVLTTDGLVYFSQGWQDFVKENSLEEKDFLVFKSKGDGCFNVMMFDGQNMCEKEAAYFVRKCDHKEENDNRRKRKAFEDSAEVVVASGEYAFGKFKWQKSQNGDTAELQSSQRVISGVTRKATRKKARRTIMLNRPARTRQSTRNKEAATQAEADQEAFPQIGGTTKAQIEETTEAILDVPDIDQTSLSDKVESKEKSFSFKSLFLQRLVTKEEKANALQVAQAALTHDGFFVVMKPTHVYKRFYLSIPSAWIAKHLIPLGTTDVILNMNDKMWCTKMWYARRGGNSGGLSYGWKTFALDNKLHEFDVCVFEPSVLSNNSIILDVKIFRVVEEVGTSNPVLKEGLSAILKDPVE